MTDPEIEASIARYETRGWDHGLTRLSHSTATRQHFGYVPRAAGVRRDPETQRPVWPIVGVPS